MQQSNNDGVTAESSNENTLSVEPQQDNTGVDNTTVPRVENQAGTTMQTCHVVSLNAGQK